MKKPQHIDMTGKVVGRLTVVALEGPDKNRRMLWRCVCVCGGSKIVNGSDLRRARTRSCGCLDRERVIPPPANPGRAIPCIVAGCRSHVSPEGDYCAVHKRRITRHGSPFRVMSISERLAAARAGRQRQLAEASS